MKKPVYKLVKGYNMNSSTKWSVPTKESAGGSVESFYANKGAFSTLRPKDIPQPVGKVFRGL